MAVFVIERYACALTLEAVEAAAARVAGAAGGMVSHVVSLFIPGDDAAISVFSAGTAAEVESAARAEGTPFERVVEVLLTPAS